MDNSEVRYLADDMTHKVIPEIEKAAARYCENRNRRMLVQKSEKESRQELMDLMLQHGQRRYMYADQMVYLASTRDVKVKTVKTNG